jgi:hypothetical protein
MNYLLGAFCPPMCYMLVPHPGFLLGSAPLEPSLLGNLESSNAENIDESSLEI